MRTKKTSPSNPDTIQESSEQKGVRLALKRMPQLQQRLKLVGNLGTYAIGSERIETMCATIDKWTEATKERLRNHKPEQERFTF